MVGEVDLVGCQSIKTSPFLSIMNRRSFFAAALAPVAAALAPAASPHLLPPLHFLMGKGHRPYVLHAGQLCREVGHFENIRFVEIVRPRTRTMYKRMSELIDRDAFQGTTTGYIWFDEP